MASRALNKTSVAGKQIKLESFFHGGARQGYCQYALF